MGNIVGRVTDITWIPVGSGPLGNQMGVSQHLSESGGSILIGHVSNIWSAEYRRGEWIYLVGRGNSEEEAKAMAQRWHDSTVLLDGLKERLNGEHRSGS